MTISWKRWTVPAGAAAIVAAAAGAGPLIASAEADPKLPDRSAEQLVADAAGAVSTPLSGTVTATSDLGLPKLPAGTGSSAVPFAGDHTARVWYGGEQRVRVAVQERAAETNFVLNGQDAWTWSSAKNTATHVRGRAPETLPGKPVTPQEAARKALDAIGGTTTVRVDGTARVAGRAAYELVLQPEDGRSLVREVRLALDGEKRVPLRVKVYGADAKPAFQVGFTKVSFTKPGADNFTFKAPPGAKVEEKTLPAPGKPDVPEPKVTGKGWTTVVSMPVPRELTAKKEVKQLIDKATKPTAEGRVLRTKLVTVLLTNDGRMLAGAVKPEVLAEAAN